MPYLIGVMLFPPVMAVALWRARVVPLWAMLVVIGGSASFAVFAGPWWVTVVWGVALLAGFSPPSGSPSVARHERCRRPSRWASRADRGAGHDSSVTVLLSLRALRRLPTSA